MRFSFEFGRSFFSFFLVLTLTFISGVLSPVSAEVIEVDVEVERYKEFDGYATYSEFAEDYGFDSQGNEYQLRSVTRVGATAEVVDLNPQAGTQNFTLQAKYNLFATKYDSDGNYVTSYYLAYSPTSGGIGMLLPKLEITDDGFYVFGQIYGSPLTVRTVSSTTAYASGQSSSNPMTFLLRYDSSFVYQNSYVVDNLVIRDVAANPNGGFYLGMYIQGTVDVDFMSGGTTSYSLANSPSTDGILGSYNADGTLDYAYRYNSVSGAAGSDVLIDKLKVTSDRIYALLAFNSNTSPQSVDLDPTGGQDLHDLHEHDPAIITFDHDGGYLWSNVVSSADIYGDYTFLDDENVDDFDLDADGNAYVGMYVDSDAVLIGDTLYEKNITGLANNNKYENFVYKVNADGTTGWSKYFPSMNTISNSIRDVFVDPLSGRIFLTVYINSGGGIEVDSVEYPNDYDIDRYFFIQLDGDGTVEHAAYLDVDGTVSDLTWEVVNQNGFEGYVDTDTNTTHVMNQFEFEANNQMSVNLDFTGQTTNQTVNFTSWTFYQPHFVLTPVNAPTPTPTPAPNNSSSVSSSGPSAEMPLPSSCDATPPGLKTPEIYAALPESSTSIRLYFTDASGPLDHYALAFGNDAGNMQYGSLNIGGLGTRTFLVSDLQPDTTYHFKIRAGNNCAPGNWSNIFSGTTKKFQKKNSLSSSGQYLGASTESAEVATSNESEATPQPSPSPQPQSSSKTEARAESKNEKSSSADNTFSVPPIVGGGVALGIIAGLGYMIKRTIL